MCFTDTIHQTETNTEHIFNKKVDHSLSEADQPIELRSSNSVEKFIEMNRATRLEENKYKFKVSPTRIKFSNAGDYGIDRKIKVSILGNEHRLTRNHGLILTNSTTVGFSDKRYKSSKQMAPAYELWPDTSENRRYVLNSEQNSRNNDYADHDTNSLRIHKFHQYDLLQTYKPKSRVNLNLKSLRGLLPKPLPVVTGSTSYRVLRERSTPGEFEDEPSSGSTREEVDLNSDENIDERSDKANLDQDNSEFESDYISKSNDDDKIFTQNPNHRQINFQILDSQQALKSVQRRRLKESQIYPPGDPSRLYADALLVYVKDFNRYIKA